MIIWLIIGFGALLLLLAALDWMSKANRRDLGKAGLAVGIALLAIFGVLLAATGKLFVALPALGSALLGLWRWRWLVKLMANRSSWGKRVAGGGGAAGGGAAGDDGQQSEIRTGWLCMRLDHASGTLSGEVQAGAFAGRSLESLDRQALMALYTELQAADAESARLLETWLERAWGADWRAQAGGGAGSDGTGGGDGEGAAARGQGGMTRREALDILGLEEGADAAAIKAAHRRLMSRLHPDHGGSDYFAAKLNEARDLLLNA